MKKLHSVFTDDMDHCYFTGSPYVERHHIFGGNKAKKQSEIRGFVIPLRPDIHPNGVHFNQRENAGMDKKLKRMALDYYLEHYGTIEQFRKEFGSTKFLN